MTRVLVMGATGNVGGALVDALFARDVEVLAVSRHARDWPAGVTGVIADAGRPDGLTEAADGVEAAFVMSGFAAEAGLLGALADDARVVALSASSAPLGDGGNALAAYHLATERAVQATTDRWTVLRPCSMQSNLLRWGDQLAAGDVITAPFGDVPTAMVDPADVAAVAALALTEPGHEGRTHRLSGPEALAPADQVAILARALRRDLRFEPVPDAEAELPDAYADAMLEVFRGHPELESDVQPTVAEVLGRPPGDLAAWVDRHAGPLGASA